MKRKKNNKKIILNRVIIILILVIIFSVYIIKVFSDKAIPQFLDYSEIETKKIISSIISSTIVDEISKDIDLDNLFITIKDSNGDVKSIDFNSSLANKILADSSRLVEQNLKYLENGDIDKLNLSNNTYDIKKLNNGVIYELPSGIIFNNVLISNLLPKIPVKMHLIGNIFCKLSTDIESYGINNALIKVNIEVEVEVKILLPFVSESTKIDAKIPIIMKIIEGNVPSYYFNGYLSTPSITNNVKN